MHKILSWLVSVLLLWALLHRPHSTQTHQTPVLPLCQSKFASSPADLVLVEAGHQLSSQFDIGSSVASLLVIIGRREDGDHLQYGNRLNKAKPLDSEQHFLEFFRISFLIYWNFNVLFEIIM